MSPFAGLWQGELSVQGMKLGVIFNIKENEDQSLACFLDVPMQSAKDIPANKTEAAGK